MALNVIKRSVQVSSAKAPRLIPQKVRTVGILSYKLMMCSCFEELSAPDIFN